MMIVGVGVSNSHQGFSGNMVVTRVVIYTGQDGLHDCISA